MGASAPQPSMDVCNGCKRLYVRTYVRLCANCMVSEEARFGLIRDFLRENEGASVAEVAEATGLSRGEVAKFQTQGRLVEVDPITGVIGNQCTCQPGGARCRYCRHQLSKTFEQHAEANRNAAELANADARRRSLPGRGGGATGKPGSENAEDGSRVHYERRKRRLN